jgi:hypothetical protein
MRPQTATAAIVLAWCGATTVVGCGGVSKGGNGAVDAGAMDAGGTATSDTSTDTSDDSTDSGGAAIDTGDDSADAGGDADAGCPAAPVETFAGATTIVTCPATAMAVDGIVTPTCDFPYSFAPNNVFTGPVTVVSHLDRDFAQFDVSQVANGRFQLMCDYANADGLGIGGIYRFMNASSCTATSAADFTCVK